MKEKSLTGNMHPNLPVYIGDDALTHLIGFCQEQGYTKFLLVADENTYLALGQSVQAALQEEDCDVVLALLQGKDVIADERYLMQVFLAADQQERVYLAVGSGTITDITRFVSHRVRAPFISVPTAPSVDGFTSIGAALIVGGMKKTYVTQAPAAVFADLPTLCAAPHRLIAAGFGDLLGKLVSTADWKMDHILHNGPYVDSISQRLREAAISSAGQVAAIGRGLPQGVHSLMEGLIESGFSMLDYGNTSPCSGAEHHISHYWEVKLLREGRPAILHGAKVGVATAITAGWYELVRQYRREEVARLLEKAQLPPVEAQIQELRAVYGALADDILAEQAQYIRMSQEEFERLKKRIVERWDQVLQIAAGVPPSEQFQEWLCQAGAPLDGSEIGLSKEEVELGKRFGHFYSQRFSINKLRLLLGLS